VRKSLVPADLNKAAVNQKANSEAPIAAFFKDTRGEGFKQFISYADIFFLNGLIEQINQISTMLTKHFLLEKEFYFFLRDVCHLPRFFKSKVFGGGRCGKDRMRARKYQ